MESQRELNLYYWSTIYDMVKSYNEKHRTNIEMWHCVKYRDKVDFLVGNPVFALDTQHYEFAIAILEGRPVFIGDKIFCKADGKEIIVVYYHKGWAIDDSLFSWSEPQQKRTFEIKGIFLPCPINKKPEYDAIDKTLCFYGQEFYFHTAEDKKEWKKAIVKLLTEARDEKISG